MPLTPIVRARPLIAAAVILLGLIAGAGFVQQGNTGSTGPRTGSGAQGSGNTAPPAPPAAPAAQPRTDQVVAVIKALTSWAVVALVLTVLFHTQLRALLTKVTDSIGSSTVSLDIGSVKLQVAEPTVTAANDRMPLWSPSPFEVDDDNTGDATAVLRDVAPQLTVPASDYVAQYWLVRQNDPRVAAMRSARAALERAAADPARTFESLRSELDAFVEALGNSLYLEADRFADLMTARPALRIAIESLAPTVVDEKQAKDFLLLYAAGAAYAQKGDWTRASARLEKIAWADTDPLYAPAGSVWLTSQYHAYLKGLERDHPAVELDSSEFFTKVNELMDRARQLLARLRTMTWDANAPPAGRGHFIRELLKDLGNIGSILADRASTPAVQGDLLQHAALDLFECTQVIDGAAPSPLDYNNLADLYRQVGDAARHNDTLGVRPDDLYAKAHGQLDQAFALDPADPAFCNTRALVYFSQGDYDRALRALEVNTEAQADAAAARDVEQYVENQILAAKLLAASAPRNQAPDLTRITSILEQASRFLNGRRARLGDGTADNLQAGIEELLGYAFLQWPRRDASAVEAFDRLFDLRRWTPLDIVKVRCHVWRARALVRLARSRRREFSGEVAAQLRERARIGLNELVVLLERFKADSSVPAGRRERNAGFRLDAVLNLQSLAEEYLAGEELMRAKSAMATETDLLSGLDKASLTGADAARMREQIQRSSARLALLDGRVLIRGEGQTADVIGKVEERFNEARGLGAEQKCLIDLELGDLLLRSARTGLGDPMHLYRRAVAAFERAAGCDAPALRGDTIRALSTAYAARDAVMRLAKAGSEKPASRAAK